MSLSLLGAASPTAAKQLATIGLTSTQLGQALRSGGFIGAIGLLRQHIKAAGLDAVQSAQLLSHAFGGGQSSSAIMTLINNFDVLKKKQDQINEGMSKYGAAVTAQRQTIQAQLDILRSTLETTGIRMGQALLPPFTKLVKFLASDLLPDVLRLGRVLGGLFKNPLVDAFVGGLLAAAVAIRTIIGLLKIWETVQKILKIEFLTSPWGIAIVAVAALAAGIAILWERSSTFRKIVEGAFRAVRDAAMDVWNWIKGHWMLLAGILLAPFAPVIAAGYLLYKLIGIVAHVFDSIKNVITGGFDSWWAGHGKELEKVWGEAWGLIKAVFDMTWGLITNAVETGWNVVMGILRPGIDLLETMFRAGWGFIAATTRGTWDLISGIFKSAWDVISGVVKIAVAGVESVIKIAWDLVVGIFDVALDLLTGHWGKAWDDIKQTVTQVWNAIKGFLGSAISDIENMFAGAWNALIGGVKSWGSDLIGYVKQIPGMILRALGDVGKMLWNAGVSIIKGLIGGITSAIGGVGHVISSVASTIKSFLPFSPAKQGPLSGKGDPYYSGV
jgi:phage-related protein